MKTIETVKEYNARQLGAGMSFQNADGSFKKRGYVVTIDGQSNFCKTLKECDKVSSKDFKKVSTLPCYSHGGHNTIEAEMNN